LTPAVAIIQADRSLTASRLSGRASTARRRGHLFIFVDDHAGAAARARLEVCFDHRGGSPVVRLRSMTPLTTRRVPGTLHNLAPGGAVAHQQWVELPPGIRHGSGEPTLAAFARPRRTAGRGPRLWLTTGPSRELRPTRGKPGSRSWSRRRWPISWNCAPRGRGADGHWLACPAGRSAPPVGVRLPPRALARRRSAIVPRWDGLDLFPPSWLSQWRPPR
jgi:hypothetical protein